MIDDSDADDSKADGEIHCMLRIVGGPRSTVLLRLLRIIIQCCQSRTYIMKKCFPHRLDLGGLLVSVYSVSVWFLCFTQDERVKSGGGSRGGPYICCSHQAMSPSHPSNQNIQHLRFTNGLMSHIERYVSLS